MNGRGIPMKTPSNPAQDTAEEVILRRSQGVKAVDASGAAATATTSDATDRRVLRNELLVSLRRVAIAGDAGDQFEAAT